MSLALQQAFAFGDWQVQPATGRLVGPAGRDVRLEPRLMDLLLLFAGSDGRVLGKDEIIAAVWGGRSIGDDTLAAAVSRLRRALGESQGRRYIETSPKRGYRCVVSGSGAPRPAPESRRPPGEAAELASRGRRALGRMTPNGFAQARAYFEAAIRAAPAWGPAHAGLADALIARQFAGLGDGEIAAARIAAHAAVGLEPGSAGAWSTLGLAILLADRDFAAAESALQRAIGEDPELAGARRNLAFALAAVGRLVEAERELRRAVSLKPKSLETRRQLVQVLIMARRYQRAVGEASTMRSVAPTSSDAWNGRGWALALAGDVAGGARDLLRGLELWGAEADWIAALTRTFEEAGFPALCRSAADLLGQQQLLFGRRRMDVAMLRAVAGEADPAFESLEAALAHDDPILLLLPWLPHFDALRIDPRYAGLLERVRPVR